MKHLKYITANAILYGRLGIIPLIFTLTALISACKKNNDGSSAPAPVITSIRMDNASPKDTVLSTGNPNTDPSWSGGTGKYIAIVGHNLQYATEIDIDGVPAAFNPALFSSTSAVVQVPQIVFSTIDTTKLYTLHYVTRSGSTTFSFKLGPAAPTISAISNVFANPGDSVHVYGTNLVLIHSFVYGGTTITSFKPSVDGTSIGFLMPAQTPTDQVIVVTKTGTVNFKIVATPTITGVSNENANPGDSVYIYGTYLKNIQSFTFAGTKINTFTTATDGSWLGFVLPTLTQAGPVSITTKFGSVTTVYNVNDIATGSISNWEWSGNFNWAWWGGANIYSGNPNSGWPAYNPDFIGNPSQYMVLKTGVLSSGEGNTYSNYAILMNGAQWIPAANLNDAVDNWAFKFEVYVKNPWNGGSIVILSGVSGHEARWEPWQVTPTKTAPYSTKGWVTVTIPLSWFKASDPTLGDGEGASIAKLTDLVGGTGNTSCTVYIHNYASTATATGFYAAFDNLRVVKIK